MIQPPGSTRQLIPNARVPITKQCEAIWVSSGLRSNFHTRSTPLPRLFYFLDRSGLQAAVVKDGKAEIRTIRVARDLGTRVEVDAGLRAGESVILNPPVTIVDGSKVQPRPQTAGRPAT